MRNVLLMTGLCAVLMTAGCVSSATQEHIQSLSVKVADLEDNITAITGQTKALYDDYKAGKLGSAEFVAASAALTAELSKTYGELKDTKDDLDRVKESAAKEGDNPFAVLLQTLLTVGAIVVGRKVGIPGLASGTVAMFGTTATSKKKK